MMLQQVFDAAIDQGFVKPSRIGPMRTAVKQYAAMFNLAADQLPSEQYQQPKDALFTFIEKHVNPMVSPRTVANLKNNIRWLLDLAVQEDWIRPLSDHTTLWRTRRPAYQQRLRRPRLDGSRWYNDAYGLLQPRDRTQLHPNLRAALDRQRAGLQFAPQALLDELDAYTRWCQSPYAPDRPAKIKKRDISTSQVVDYVCRVGGYAVHIAGIPLDQISLDRLTDPTFVQNFVAWWVNTRRGRVTRTITGILARLHTIALYWLKQPERASALRLILNSLDHAVGPVFDKEASLVSLQVLEQAGLALYPFHEAQLHRHNANRYLYRHLKDPAQYPLRGQWITQSWSKTGSRLMASLLIRLLVRVPMRQRNLREMQLHRNLRRLSDGSWEIYFRGDELKVGARKGSGINEYRQPFPRELETVLDEWLTHFRPRRLRDRDSSLLFVTKDGRPYRDTTMTTLFFTNVYRLTGLRTTIHMVRDSWAFEYLDATGDVAGCADKLGDTVETVLKHYAHVLKHRAQGRTDAWLQAHLGTGQG
jgi:hypothetical protein